MKAMRFDLKMYGALVKMAMRSLMQYRADFWTSQKQVSALFLMEAVILLLGAAIVAGAVAMALMKALFVWFFELKEMQSLSWVIFHVNFWKLLAIAAAYLCAMAAILLLTLRGLCRAPIVQLMREDAEGNRVRRPRRRLRAGRSAVASVRRMLLSRANGRYVSCLLLSVPVAVSVFVAANTVLSSIAVVNPRPEYELRVTQMRENEQGGWFTEEDRSAIRALSGVRDVQSGSGKTTLLNMIGCIERPTSGRVLLEGKDLTAMEDEALARVRRRRIGHVYQDFRLLEMLTAEENIRMPCLLDNRPADEKRLRALAKLLGVDQRLRHLPRELSGGQRQRVAIARALINDPALLLADEPTGNLDRRSADDTMELLRELNRQGCTILLVTHEERYADMCSRKIRMTDGCAAEA